AFDRLANFLGEIARLARGKVRAENHELLAAVAGDELVPAGAVLQDRRDLFQSSIPCRMSITIVVMFGVIDVDEEDRILLGLDLRSFMLERESRLERTKI